MAEGFHARVKTTAAIEAMTSAALPLDVKVSPVIGPVDDAAAPNPVRELTVAALVRRLTEVMSAAPDGVVLAACGSPVSRGAAAIDALARALGSAMAVPCRPGFVALGRPTVAQAVSSLRQRGFGQVVVATYLVGPGRRFGQVLAEATREGVKAVAPPLGSAPELVDIVLHRAAQADSSWWAARS